MEAVQGPAVTHLSVRVPWQDTSWDGRVCLDPANNQSCVVLRAIAENRDDSAENERRGQWMADLGQTKNRLATRNAARFCLTERSRSMSDWITQNGATLISTFKEQPYGCRRTGLRSCLSAGCCVRTLTILRKNSGSRYVRSVSPPIRLFARTDWIQNHDNQQVLLGRVCRTMRREGIASILFTPNAHRSLTTIVALLSLSDCCLTKEK